VFRMYRSMHCEGKKERESVGAGRLFEKCIPPRSSFWSQKVMRLLLPAGIAAVIAAQTSWIEPLNEGRNRASGEWLRRLLKGTHSTAVIREYGVMLRGSRQAHVCTRKVASKAEPKNEVQRSNDGPRPADRDEKDMVSRQPLVLLLLFCFLG
jgi:hypothetical protein